MAHRPFLMWPDKRLLAKVPPIEAVTDDTRAIWDEMVEAMEAMPGVGLAAVQLGIMQRLAIVDASESRGQVVRMANPEIIHASVKLRDHEEASPNLPGVSAPISRPRAVTVRFLNESGEMTERDFIDIWATSVQHQIDHLDGKLYIHHLSKLKRDRLVAKARKLRA
ncbi:MAG: peptide deformylase [Maritimibacter sp.]